MFTRLLVWCSQPNYALLNLFFVSLIKLQTIRGHFCWGFFRLIWWIHQSHKHYYVCRPCHYTMLQNVTIMLLHIILVTTFLHSHLNGLQSNCNNLHEHGHMASIKNTPGSVTHLFTILSLAAREAAAFAENIHCGYFSLQISITITQFTLGRSLAHTQINTKIPSTKT